MANEEFSKRIEDMESKLAEMEDLQLSNKIEILEMKADLEELAEGRAVPTGGEGEGTPKAPKPASEDIVKAVEELHKSMNKMQKRVDKLSDEVRELKERGPAEAETEKPPELEVGEIDTKLSKVEELMGGD